MLSSELDGTHVHYSYRHPCLLTVSVDGLNGQRNSTSPVDTQEWHLPTFDPRNETKYLYRLHTVDIYFWVKEDAQKFLGAVRRLLPAQQITVEDEPVASPSHTQEVSPIVQNLENVAITDSSYQQSHARVSRNTSISSSTHNSQASAAQLNRDMSRSSVSSGSLPGPPPPPANQAPAAFQPLAYNPAAPAAPEVVKHREKTPPPEDGAANPLVAAANADQGQTYGAPYQFPGGGFSGPPPSALSPQQSYFPSTPAQIPSAPPPQQAQPQSPFAQHFQNQFAPPPTSATVPPPPAYQAPAASQTPTTQTFSPSFASPTAGVPTPPTYNPVVAPPGGFAQFNYNPALSHTKPLMNDYSIHSQLYRPTEVEAAQNAKPVKQAKPASGKMEARAGKMEKGVNGLLKRLEKKIG